MTTAQIAGLDSILTKEAIVFVKTLHKKFNNRRVSLLNNRKVRQQSFDQGVLPDFLKETLEVRTSNWVIAPTPKDLQKRHVEITGPVEAKMMINALNSGANAFMADIEDSLSPTWSNIIQGQIYLKEAVRKTLKFDAPNGKKYKLNETIATLLVRPRGWHLEEKHFTVDKTPVSASLFDFGLYFFHNAKERINRGTAPYFYLPKLESHLEARLWNDVFNFAQDEFQIPRGTIKATVLIETILAAYEMDEILFELKEHSAGLNAGRWDYIFSTIKKFKSRADFTLPDRTQIAMTVPFMRAYTEALVSTCHKRQAHAMGGMAAFVPSRRDAQVNEVALKKVTEDKEREANDGFDGTWIAHPDLVSVARTSFEKVLGEKPHQKNRLRAEVKVTKEDLVNFNIPGGKITKAGVLNNISVALQYLNYWIQGTGAAAIYNLMEDAATAEISRAQLWQWVKSNAKLDNGQILDASLYKAFRAQELERLQALGQGRYQDVVEILDGLVLSDDFSEFLTLPAYAYLD